MEQKTCNKCGDTKPTDAFPIDKSRKDGLAYRCNECNRKAVSESNKRNRDIVNKRTREKRAKNPEMYREISKKSKARVPPEIRKDRVNRYEKRARENLAKSYIINALVFQKRIHRRLITPELVELKRAQIAIHRHTTQLVKLIKEKKDEH
jgi:hypothetical protein